MTAPTYAELTQLLREIMDAAVVNGDDQLSPRIMNKLSAMHARIAESERIYQRMRVLEQQRVELAEALRSMIAEISWFVSQEKDLSERLPDTHKIWAKVLDEDLDIGRAVLVELQS